MIEHNLNNSKHVLYTDIPEGYIKQFTFTNEEFHSIRFACFYALSHVRDMSSIVRDNLLKFLPDYYDPESYDSYCPEDCGICSFYLPENGGCQNPRFD